MDQTLRQCFKGVAYCYFHPQEKDKRKILDDLLLKAWYMGYAKSYFEMANKNITIDDMTMWEVGYILKDLVDMKTFT